MVNIDEDGCPKGWKLPDSATSNSDITKGTYAYLLQQYGLVTAWNSGAITGSSNVSGSDGTLNRYDIALSPLFWVRGGVVDPYYASGTPFRSAGSYGGYWSSRAYSATSYAYGLAFDTSVNPSNGFNDRCFGRSLRCFIPTP